MKKKTAKQEIRTAVIQHRKQVERERQAERNNQRLLKYSYIESELQSERNRQKALMAIMSRKGV